jgi:hypothetical protein
MNDDEYAVQIQSDDPVRLRVLYLVDVHNVHGVHGVHDVDVDTLIDPNDQTYTNRRKSQL